MALIQCPDCKKEVSENAVTCIGCGCPLGADKESEGSGVNHLTTTQLTSKSLKLQSALAGTAFVVGGVMYWVAASNNNTPGMVATVLFVGGLLWYIKIAIRKWWHHG